jgi:hypothetical protein
LHFVYIDDSGDEKVRCYSALIIHESSWKDIQSKVRQYRRDLKKTDGMFVTKELHATEFISGRGRVGNEIVSKWRRCQIFNETLALVAGFPNIHMLNAIGSRTNDRLIFERLVNRINRTMRELESNAIIFHDEGKDYTRLIRRLCIYNPIRSMYGVWPGGSPTKNMPISNILEDIVFRDSKESIFIQLADFCAYALFRHEYPLASKSKYGLDRAFSNLHPLCIKEAYRGDPKKLGIIRDK